MSVSQHAHTEKATAGCSDGDTRGVCACTHTALAHIGGVAWIWMH